VSQLTILFKDRILSVHTLDRFSEMLVGSDQHCHIIIDSLAINPQHAKIIYNNHSYAIKALSDQSDIIINGVKIHSCTDLSDGDQIALGKHTMSFTFDERNSAPTPQKPETDPFAHSTESTTGWIQYLNGVNMGKTLQIKQGMTNISDTTEEHIALLSHRNDGFYISHLKGKHPPQVNGKTIGDKSATLANDSSIFLGAQELLFYITKS